MSASRHECSVGISIGTVIAVIISWMKWHSIAWAAFHGLLGWLYVIYYLCMGYGG